MPTSVTFDLWNAIVLFNHRSTLFELCWFTLWVGLSTSPEKQSLFHFMYSRVSLNGPCKSLRMPSELYHRETQDDARQVSAAPSLPAFTKQDQNCKITLQESGGKPGQLISGKKGADRLRRNTTKSQACVYPVNKCHGSWITVVWIHFSVAEQKEHNESNAVRESLEPVRRRQALRSSLSGRRHPDHLWVHSNTRRQCGG